MTDTVMRDKGGAELMLISLAKEIDYQSDVDAERLDAGQHDFPPLIDKLRRTWGLTTFAGLEIAKFSGF